MKRNAPNTPGDLEDEAINCMDNRNNAWIISRNILHKKRNNVLLYRTCKLLHIIRQNKSTNQPLHKMRKTNTMKLLFKMPKPELKLELQDVATSDDPLEIYLQRKGWKMVRVKEIQNDISSKLTVDILDGTTHQLNRGELELQSDIQDFLDTL